MKTAQKKQAPKETAPSTPAINDFFTQFLEKRQKHFVKKLEKISELEKKKPNELTPEQNELVQNRHLTLDKIKYFDDIKDLYTQANSKKEVPVAKAPEPDNSKGSSNTASHMLNLFFTGHVLQHLTNTSQQAIESSLSKDQQIVVSALHAKVFSHSHTHSSLEEAKAQLGEALNDASLMTALNITVSSRILEKHDHHEAPVCQQQPPKVQMCVKPPPQAPVQSLFHHSSEDEEEEPQPAPVQKNVKPQKPAFNPSNNEQGIKISALPEDNNEGEDRWLTAGNSGHRGRGGRGRGQRGRRNRGEDQNEDERPRHHRRREDNEADNADNEKEGQEQKEGDQEIERRDHRGFRGHRRGGRGRGRNPNQEQGRAEEGAEKNQEAPVTESFVKHKYWNNRGEGQEDQREGQERGGRGRGGRGYRPRGEGNYNCGVDRVQGRGENRGQGNDNRRYRNNNQAPQESNQ